ncbi:MAG: hypothetical protein Q8J76_02035, partial [Desulfobulbaceae bacterium]|nr:hypothetical protein [Desulfobulbaceae bacterium]
MTTDSHKTKRTLLLALACLLIIIIGGISAVNALVRHEKQRDLDAWKLTLNVMADSRTKQIQHWI